MDQSEIVFSRLNDGWIATFSVRFKGSKKAQRRLKEGWTWLQHQVSPNQVRPCLLARCEKKKPNQTNMVFTSLWYHWQTKFIKYCSTGNCVKLGKTWIHSDFETNPVHQKTFFIIKWLGWASAYIKQIISKGSISGWPGRTQYTNTNMKYKNNWSPGQYTNIKLSQIQISNIKYKIHWSPG